MEDSSHLEKMGRELKCPICLSLLNSAVSLTCNHVFCNVCIVKSMKSCYNCPVCIVPYRRREVRAAPHMDNLVSIYKSMEVASGVNIFVTQNAPSSKSSDEEKQIEDDPTSGQNIGNICQDKAENQGTSKRKVRRKSANSNLETSGFISSKPSFPTKKRVHVPLYPLSETSPQPVKLDGELVGSIKDQSSSVDLGKKPVPNEKKQMVLPPFFWLREEEDEEKLSPQASGEHIEYITPPSVPCFSDIKDSDDECPSPRAQANEKSSGENFFDSEMFEWTQRACSPELLSTPVKAQDWNNEEFQERALKEVLQGTKTNEPVTKSAECMHVDLRSPLSKDSNYRKGTVKSNKRGRNTKKKAPRKCGEKNAPDMSEAPVNSEKEFEKVVERRTRNNDGGVVDLKKRKKKCKMTDLSAATELTPQIPVLSVRAENLDQNDRGVEKLPASLGNDHVGGGNLNLEETRKGHVRSNALPQKDGLGSMKCKSKNLSLKKIMLEEVSATQKQKTEDVIPQVSSSSIPKDGNKRASNVNEITNKHAKEIKSVLSLKCNQEIRGRKKRKVSFSGISKDCLVDENQEGDGNVSAKETKPIEQVRVSPYLNVLEDPSTPGTLPLGSAVNLHKCNSLRPEFQCAFCLSSEDSEASGEMVHYYNGRPVASDFNGGSKIIHSHRSCTEWAPNVYFENDMAVNLEAELARSRRIKCCVCGRKGAALGCYEKSCRKSFHVPCAKLIPQCRWDAENFVMLCPLHPSSKLPNEIPESRERTKRKIIPKLQIPTNGNKEVLKPDTSTSGHWKSSRSSNKLVLCCSALTVGEREIVSEFERLSGTKVSKNWDSSVTHVIASTDENRACKRTLKVLKGILEGKWILSIEWVKACIKVMEPVDEEQYEISVDTHGFKDGPRLGRLRVQNMEPKLFDGLEFYFIGDFVPSYKGYLQDLIIAAGGSILQRKPISRDQGILMSSSRKFSTFIIYSVEVPDKCDPGKKDVILDRNRSEAEALANFCAAKAVSNSWVLNSIAACKLQSFV